MTIDTDRTLSIAVCRKDTHIDQYLNFHSNHPLHQKHGLAKALFCRADNPVPKPDDMLSVQGHLRQCRKQCGHKNSIIDHAINFSKRHGAKTAISINQVYFQINMYKK